MIANLYIAHVALEDQSACVKEEEAGLRLGLVETQTGCHYKADLLSCSHGINVTLGPNLSFVIIIKYIKIPPQITNHMPPKPEVM